MAYIRKNKKVLLKRYVMVAAVLISVLVLSAAGYAYKQSQGSQKIVASAAKITDKHEKYVVRAKYSLSSGDMIDISKFELINIPEGFVPDKAVLSLSALEDMRLKNNIEQREIVLLSDLMPQNAWYEDGDRLIEHNFQDGTVPGEVATGSIVDIKLFRQGAEDDVVVSRVTVINRSASLLTFYLNESEQESIKEAATEGMLFAVKYIDAVQSPSSVTYIPSFKRKGSHAKGKVTEEEFANTPNLQ